MNIFDLVLVNNEEKTLILSLKNQIISDFDL